MLKREKISPDDVLQLSEARERFDSEAARLTQQALEEKVSADEAVREIKQRQAQAEGIIRPAQVPF